MRFILSLFIIMAFVSPSIAAENKDDQKPSVVKGSKSYQVRYAKPAPSLESVEPAAGVEMQTPKDENPRVIQSEADESTPPKPMRLHGKK